MTKDKGIFILETAGPEYRVTLAKAEPGIVGHWNYQTEKYEYDPILMKEIFGEKTVFSDKEKAVSEAAKLAYFAEVDNTYLEYGIMLIDKWKNLRYDSL